MVDDGQTTDYGYTVKLTNEPKGSGELKMDEKTNDQSRAPDNFSGNWVFHSLKFY